MKRITYSILGSILECPYLGKLPERESSGKEKDVQGEVKAKVVIWQRASVFNDTPRVEGGAPRSEMVLRHFLFATELLFCHSCDWCWSSAPTFLLSCGFRV